MIGTTPDLERHLASLAGQRTVDEHDTAIVAASERDSPGYESFGQNLDDGTGDRLGRPLDVVGSGIGMVGHLRTLGG